ncbi:aminoglycoside phosphotransferase (APT) family kinase protein [Thermocatellispora tengchongensis]|uniref:Aminoglycoside phosphotransferase (APT) family kinase protein n=1 Tax=Thermocatellispora tengchongensis TaxID=1073253 RepID=A0A840NYD6_9ACTN|nr:phosphotransferase family protein [Thermocatellispora tengchongensis]MBB5131226.1 aminoglycoside phosphotransferase (APT) family kinase protein [Thermocatellispora tengchongensis]
MTTTHIDVNVIDFDALGAWMDAQGLPGGPFEDVSPVAGGTQNVMVRFSRGGVPYVLRRPPLHLRAKSNEVLRREARVLAALGGTPVAAPRLVAACTDESVLGGAVFYLMEPVDGFNASTGLPEPHASDPAIRHRMGLEAAAALAELGRVDHEAVGLAGFGRPEGFLERQVPRWMGELEGYSALDGYPGPDIPGLERTAAWLEDNRPAAFTPGIMHGDYHLSNLMFAYDGPRVAAIVDWEMCTIGDPLLDLGWLLATWPGGEGDWGIGTTITGLPEGRELVAHYAALSGRDLSAINWYATMACFKLGIVLEGTHARACAGKAPKDIGDALHATTLALFARAQTFME